MADMNTQPTQGNHAICTYVVLFLIVWTLAATNAQCHELRTLTV